MTLFSGHQGLEHIQLPGAELWYQPDFYSQIQADNHLLALQQLAWQQLSIRLYGKEVLQPRQQVWFGDKPYTYSGLTLTPAPWTALLSQLKRDVELTSGHSFNTVLGNLYRDGSDYMGWHSDDEVELGPDPVIASLSFGETRRFLLRHKTTGEKLELALPHGALLIMGGSTQHYWQHQVAKTQKPCRLRINLTFRDVCMT
ncbi:alpha-ketoglutarate-dependent dioxygenase AlkB [Motilimonas cestriensis]|uniref:Alpha-ketoglutarate-dependent dioxygenase AlkB n=1 Tax=Motilimonas cestriensis TaxID=2742685 RepID=A0ABS8W3T0_9GAMM|nr:alpha-ketoglutarate-dependent dioxygenase AlkB [Motilimonas cestriensis]MCE2593611.1 alpha-ketoglutarate-dependent dioxygenase AlkB [Motilimonas cestriensis]